MGPGAIECTFFYRESALDGAGEFEEDVIRVTSGERKRVSLASLGFEVNYEDSSFGTSAGLQVVAGERAVVQVLYQFPQGRLPANQFIPDHGFTGLMYVTHPTEGGDYQFFCRSEN